MQRTLPLHSPPITTYLFHLYPLSILAQDEAYLPWLYSTHIQLFNFPGEELKFYTHPFCTRHQIRHVYHPACPFLDIQTIDREALGLSAADLIQQFIEFLDHDYYVQTDLDFFYVPDREHYQHRHFIHEVLISGYDAQAKTFTISGFDAQGRYAVTDLSWDTLKQALSFTREALIRHVMQAGRALPAWILPSMEDRPRLILYKYLPEQTYAFDPLAVAGQLDDYLSAHDTSKHYRLLATPRQGAVWGTAVYPFLRSEIESWADNPAAYSDIPLRLLWEHKTCMQARLQYMEGQGHLDPAEQLARRFTEVEKKTSSLRLALLRWKTRPRTGTLTRACSMLDTIAAQEQSLLERVLEVLNPRGTPDI